VRWLPASACTPASVASRGVRGRSDRRAPNAHRSYIVGVPGRPATRGECSVERDPVAEAAAVRPTGCRGCRARSNLASDPATTGNSAELDPTDVGEHETIEPASMERDGSWAQRAALGFHAWSSTANVGESRGQMSATGHRPPPCGALPGPLGRGLSAKHAARPAVARPVPGRAISSPRQASP